MIKYIFILCMGLISCNSDKQSNNSDDEKFKVELQNIKDDIGGWSFENRKGELFDFKYQISRNPKDLQHFYKITLELSHNGECHGFTTYQALANLDELPQENENIFIKQPTFPLYRKKSLPGKYDLRWVFIKPSKWEDKCILASNNTLYSISKADFTNLFYQTLDHINLIVTSGDRTDELQGILKLKPYEEALVLGSQFVLPQIAFKHMISPLLNMIDQSIDGVAFRTDSFNYYLRNNKFEIIDPNQHDIEYFELVSINFSERDSILADILTKIINKFEVFQFNFLDNEYKKLRNEDKLTRDERINRVTLEIRHLIDSYSDQLNPLFNERKP